MPRLRDLLQAPRSLLQAVYRKSFNHYPPLPWIPFSASAFLDRIIQPSWTVLEVGAGYSTPWLAQRCATLTAIEANAEWRNRIRTVTEARGLSNVRFRDEVEGGGMAGYSEFPDESLDLALIDGGPRERCVKNVLTKIRRGGYVYLDNTDVPALVAGGGSILLDWVNHDRRYFRFFVGFVPGSFVVSEGLLVQRPPA